MKIQRLLLMFFSVALLLCCSVILSLSKGALAFTLPDTGQTKCYDEIAGTEIACAGTGQDGEYNINPMSYTDNGNGTITDNVTGLIWQKGENSTYYNWYQASGTYDATNNASSQSVCGSLTLGGQSDWRLPTKKELITIVDYGVPLPGPTINTTYFPNTYADGYWSSTTTAHLHELRPEVGALSSGAWASAMATSTTTVSPTSVMSGASGADSLGHYVIWLFLLPPKPSHQPAAQAV